MKNIIIKFLLLIFGMFVSITLSMTLKAEKVEVNWNDYYWKKATILPANFPAIYWLEFYFLPSNPKYGYAVGAELIYGDPNGRGAFAKTTDSGKTWTASYIDRTRDFHAESVIFVDTNVGYCSGGSNIGSPGALYKTTDGGKTWKSINNFSGSWGCYAIGNNVWIADGSCYGKDNQTMYRSTNGGNSWQTSTIAGNNHITDFKMNDAKNGYAIGSGAIFITSDGGGNWKNLCNTGTIQWSTQPATNINWHEDINIYNKSILIPASPGCQGNSSDNQGAALFSSDFGETWRVFKTRGSTFGTWLTNDSCGWVCGYYKEVYFTPNYGENWFLMNCGIENNANMDDLWFINDSIGFICGEGGIYRLLKKDDSISITGDSTVCDKDYAILKADKDFEKYEWYQITSQGDTIPINKKTKDVVIENAGKYIVKGIHIDNCYYVYSEPFTVSKGADKPGITLTTHCFGDSIIVDFKEIDNIIEWFFYPQIEYSNIGSIKSNQLIFINYSDNIDKIAFVYGSIENECIDTLWFNITFKERIKPILKSDGITTFCDNVDRTLYIENAEYFDKNTWYLDDNQIAENTNSYKPKQSGTYKVIASNEGNCVDSSDTITITITDERDVLQIIGVDSTFFVDSVNYGKQSYRKFIIHNTGDKVFVLDNITFRYKFAFTTPLSQFPMTIQPNGYADLIVYYTPTNLNWQYDTIYIEDYCSTIPISLSGFGKGNSDTTSAACNIMVVISTRSIEQKEIVKLGLPIPNPIDSKGKITYKIIIETEGIIGNIENSVGNNVSEEFTFQLYDVIGTLININYDILKKDTEIFDNTTTHNGEINFDMKNLPIGVYFIKISYGTANKIFSVIKE